LSCDKTGIKADNSRRTFIFQAYFTFWETAVFHVKQRGSMANKKGRKQQKKQVKRGRRRMSPVLLLAIVLIGGFFGWMHMGAKITHVRYADVYLEDLPAQFVGTRILFISDINIRSQREAAACTRLMHQLNELNADMLILGGDYSADNILDTLNGKTGNNEVYALNFIRGLHVFNYPLGKFAVSGENDSEAIEDAFTQAGVQHLEDACATVEKNGAQLVIAGLGDDSRKRTPYEEIGGYFNGDECVIAAVHNPSAYVGIRVAEARGGGAWADMVLSGHTLGGQIKLFDRTIRTMAEEESRCIAGWYYGDDLPLLVSQGLGCKDAALRLDTRSEIWCITLCAPETQQPLLPDL